MVTCAIAAKTATISSLSGRIGNPMDGRLPIAAKSATHPAVAVRFAAKTATASRILVKTATGAFVTRAILYQRNRLSASVFRYGDESRVAVRRRLSQMLFAFPPAGRNM